MASDSQTSALSRYWPKKKGSHTIYYEYYVRIACLLAILDCRPFIIGLKLELRDSLSFRKSIVLGNPVVIVVYPPTTPPFQLMLMVSHMVWPCLVDIAYYHLSVSDTHAPMPWATMWLSHRRWPVSTRWSLDKKRTHIAWWSWFWTNSIDRHWVDLVTDWPTNRKPDKWSRPTGLHKLHTLTNWF